MMLDHGPCYLCGRYVNHSLTSGKPFRHEVPNSNGRVCEASMGSERPPAPKPTAPAKKDRSYRELSRELALAKKKLAIVTKQRDELQDRLDQVFVDVMDKTNSGGSLVIIGKRPKRGGPVPKRMGTFPNIEY